jgi:16S rRNA (uracil1498-N3)-methyltransferase
VIFSPRSLDQICGSGEPWRKLFLSERRGIVLREILKKPAAPSVIVAVGPEGGWTVGEEEYLRQSSFEAVSLGRRILRAETAAIAAVAMISHFWNP